MREGSKMEELKKNQKFHGRRIWGYNITTGTV